MAFLPGFAGDQSSIVGDVARREVEFGDWEGGDVVVSEFGWMWGLSGVGR